MMRTVLAGLLFLASLLVVFRAPTSLLWYLSILVTEFCWIFLLLSGALIFWRSGSGMIQLLATTLAIIAFILFSLPLLQAYRLGARLETAFAEVFPSSLPPSPPFQPLRMVTGIGAAKHPYTTLVYDSTHQLSLDFYRSRVAGFRPTVVVIHGGSWAGGDSQQLPELNSVLARAGYHVASINYRLAPNAVFPAPVEDVQRAIRFLEKNAASLGVDASNLVLLGRSAGGQIALSAAYTLREKGLKGVISFYGPTDMAWGYENPTNPLVLDSRKVMRDYLGGSLTQKPEQYAASSATETVSRTAPPTLLIYAENDPLVSPRHGNRLTLPLQQNGVRFYALYLPWATHGFDYTLNGPGGQLSTWATLRFLANVCPLP